MLKLSILYRYAIYPILNLYTFDIFEVLHILSHHHHVLDDSSATNEEVIITGWCTCHTQTCLLYTVKVEYGCDRQHIDVIEKFIQLLVLVLRTALQLAIFFTSSKTTLTDYQCVSTG